MRQARQVPEREAVSGRRSPQREHTGAFWTGNSAQQLSQTGADDRSGKEEPQRVQTAGSKAQLAASMGLRSTRTTARHAEVPEGGTSTVSALGVLLKTHLSGRKPAVASFLPLFLTLS